MNKVYKHISFTVLGFILSIISWKLKSSFADQFANSLLSLLVTLFAINIASSTLIAGKLKELEDKLHYKFSKTKASLKKSFKEQIILIIVAAGTSLLRNSEVLQTWISKEICYLFFDGLLFLVFIYYLDIIMDIGKSLFDLLDHDETNSSNQG